MVPTTVNGVPTHPLLVHAVVVLVPLAAILLILVAVRPSAGRRLGLVVPALAVVALGFIPLTTNAGEWLQRRIAPTPLLRAHTGIADNLLPWSIAVGVLAIALWSLRGPIARRVSPVRPGGGPERPDAESVEPSDFGSAAGSSSASMVSVAERAPASSSTPGWLRPVTALVAALAVVAAIGSVVEVYLIGESGAQAVWQGQFSETPNPRPPHQSGG